MKGLHRHHDISFLRGTRRGAAQERGTRRLADNYLWLGLASQSGDGR